MTEETRRARRELAAAALTGLMGNAYYAEAIAKDAVDKFGPEYVRRIDREEFIVRTLRRRAVLMADEVLGELDRMADACDERAAAGGGDT